MDMTNKEQYKKLDDLIEREKNRHQNKANRIMVSLEESKEVKEVSPVRRRASIDQIFTLKSSSNSSPRRSASFNGDSKSKSNEEERLQKMHQPVAFQFKSTPMRAGQGNRLDGQKHFGNKYNPKVGQGGYNRVNSNNMNLDIQRSPMLPPIRESDSSSRQGRAKRLDKVEPELEPSYSQSN